MNNTETLKLLDGHFQNEDATEILMSIISSNINFYNVKNLSSSVRFGCGDEIAQQTIARLNNEMRKLRVVLAEAKTKNKKLVISSEVRISLVDAK